MNSYIVDINEKLLNKTILIFSVNTVKFNLAVNGGDYNSTVKSSIFAIWNISASVKTVQIFYCNHGVSIWTNIK